MEDGYRLIDYGINVNDVVQLMIRAAPLPSAVGAENGTKTEGEEDGIEKETKTKPVDDSLVDATCEFYEVFIFLKNYYM